MYLIFVVLKFGLPALYRSAALRWAVQCIERQSYARRLFKKFVVFFRTLQTPLPVWVTADNFTFFG
ncbi:MAG: hypothetical protein EAZ13_04330 [Sphingobacteriia bacterium]|nr:MAG: hypothetical protein EAZ13_04330 [Sphingobacteriia bacterium]